MRLKINLATQPYQDVRRMLFLWGFGAALAVIVTGALLWAAVSSFSTWRHTTRQMNELRAKIAACNHQSQAAKKMLAQPQNRTTRDQSLFINTLIARKAFSWTEVLSDLERMMPSGIHVLGITPEIKEDNQLQLRLSAAGPSRDRAIELIRRMENSSQFSNVLLQSDVAEERQNGSNTRLETVYHFEITAFYVPTYQRKASDEPETVAQAKGGQ